MGLTYCFSIDNDLVFHNKFILPTELIAELGELYLSV